MASVSSHRSVVSGARRGWPASRIAFGVTTMRGGAGALAAGAGADEAGADAMEGAGAVRAADATAAASAATQAKVPARYIESPYSHRLRYKETGTGCQPSSLPGLAWKS